MSEKSGGPGPGGAGPMGEKGDGELLASAAGGDLLAFRALVSRHLAGVVAVARCLLRDEAEAEDIAQETMLRLWKNATSIEIGAGEQSLKPWLGRVARNLSVDRLRSQKRITVVDEVPDQPVPADQARHVEETETAQRVARAIAQLPENQRLALTLFHYEAQSQREVAETLSLTVEAVESLLARARRALKAKLQHEWRALLEESGT